MSKVVKFAHTMAKRNASNELTDRNWDLEDAPEEAGIFTQASKDILKQRQMKKAKRRTTNDSVADVPFMGFKGFPGLKDKSTGSNLASVKIPVQRSTTQFVLTKADTDNSSQIFKTETYYSSIKCLNSSLLSWIQKHLNRDPYCILSPIFDDYKKYVEEIKKDNSDKENEDAERVDDSDPEVKINLCPGKAGGNLNSFGTPCSVSSLSGFQLTSGIRKSHVGNSSVTEIASEKVSATEEVSEEDVYVPPKPESVEVNEEGSVCSKRCKLFYQKDGVWKDRGVGYFHIKLLDGSKAQIIVRADTILGNILLNIMLTEAIPVKRQGKNNILLFCIPNPPLHPKDDSNTPVQMLIRVKTTEDADEVLKKIEEIKGVY